MPDVITDWYGSALGFSDAEIKTAYVASSLLENHIQELIPGASYDPISYHRQDNKLLLRGEISVKGDVFIVDLDPGEGIQDLQKSLIDAVCFHIGTTSRSLDTISRFYK